MLGSVGNGDINNWYSLFKLHGSSIAGVQWPGLQSHLNLIKLLDSDLSIQHLRDRLVWLATSAWGCQLKGK